MDADFTFSATRNADVVGVLRTILLFLDSQNLVETSNVLKQEASRLGHGNFQKTNPKIIVLKPSVAEVHRIPMYSPNSKSNQADFPIDATQSYILESSVYEITEQNHMAEQSKSINIVYSGKTKFNDRDFSSEPTECSCCCRLYSATSFATEYQDSTPSERLIALKAKESYKSQKQSNVTDTSSLSQLPCCLKIAAEAYKQKVLGNQSVSIKSLPEEFLKYRQCQCQTCADNFMETKSALLKAQSGPTCAEHIIETLKAKRSEQEPEDCIKKLAELEEDYKKLQDSVKLLANVLEQDKDRDSDSVIAMIENIKKMYPGLFTEEETIKEEKDEVMKEPPAKKQSKTVSKSAPPKISLRANKQGDKKFLDAMKDCPGPCKEVIQKFIDEGLSEEEQTVKMKEVRKSSGRKNKDLPMEKCPDSCQYFDCIDLNEGGEGEAVKDLERGRRKEKEKENVSSAKITIRGKEQTPTKDSKKKSSLDSSAEEEFNKGVRESMLTKSGTLNLTLADQKLLEEMKEVQGAKEELTKLIFIKMKKCRGKCWSHMLKLNANNKMTPDELISKVKEIRYNNRHLFRDRDCMKKSETCLNFVCAHLDDLDDLAKKMAQEEIPPPKKETKSTKSSPRKKSASQEISPIKKEEETASKEESETDSQKKSPKKQKSRKSSPGTPRKTSDSKSSKEGSLTADEESKKSDVKSLESAPKPATDKPRVSCLDAMQDGNIKNATQICPGPCEERMLKLTDVLEDGDAVYAAVIEEQKAATQKVVECPAACDNFLCIPEKAIGEISRLKQEDTISKKSKRPSIQRSGDSSKGTLASTSTLEEAPTQSSGKLRCASKTKSKSASKGSLGKEKSSSKDPLEWSIPYRSALEIIGEDAFQRCSTIEDPNLFATEMKLCPGNCEEILKGLEEEGLTIIEQLEKIRDILNEPVEPGEKCPVACNHLRCISKDRFDFELLADVRRSLREEDAKKMKKTTAESAPKRRSSKSRKTSADFKSSVEKGKSKSCSPKRSKKSSPKKDKPICDTTDEDECYACQAVLDDLNIDSLSEGEAIEKIKEKQAIAPQIEGETCPDICQNLTCLDMELLEATGSRGSKQSSDKGSKTSSTRRASGAKIVVRGTAEKVPKGPKTCEKGEDEDCPPCKEVLDDLNVEGLSEEEAKKKIEEKQAEFVGDEEPICPESCKTLTCLDTEMLGVIVEEDESKGGTKKSKEPGVSCEKADDEECLPCQEALDDLNVEGLSAEEAIEKIREKQAEFSGDESQTCPETCKTLTCLDTDMVGVDVDEKEPKSKKGPKSSRKGSKSSSTGKTSARVSTCEKPDEEYCLPCQEVFDNLDIEGLSEEEALEKVREKQAESTGDVEEICPDSCKSLTCADSEKMARIIKEKRGSVSSSARSSKQSSRKGSKTSSTGRSSQESIPSTSGARVSACEKPLDEECLPCQEVLDDLNLDGLFEEDAMEKIRQKQSESTGDEEQTCPDSCKSLSCVDSETIGTIVKEKGLKGSRRSSSASSSKGSKQRSRKGSKTSGVRQAKESKPPATEQRLSTCENADSEECQPCQAVFDDLNKEDLSGGEIVEKIKEKQAEFVGDEDATCPETCKTLTCVDSEMIDIIMKERGSERGSKQSSEKESKLSSEKGSKQSSGKGSKASSTGKTSDAAKTGKEPIVSTCEKLDDEECLPCQEVLEDLHVEGLSKDEIVEVIKEKQFEFTGDDQQTCPDICKTLTCLDSEMVGVMDENEPDSARGSSSSYERDAARISACEKVDGEECAPCLEAFKDLDVEGLSKDEVIEMIRDKQLEFPDDVNETCPITCKHLTCLDLDDSEATRKGKSSKTAKTSKPCTPVGSKPGKSSDVAKGIISETVDKIPYTSKLSKTCERADEEECQTCQGVLDDLQLEGLTKEEIIEKIRQKQSEFTGDEDATCPDTCKYLTCLDLDMLGVIMEEETEGESGEKKRTRASICEKTGEEECDTCQEVVEGLNLEGLSTDEVAEMIKEKQSEFTGDEDATCPETCKNLTCFDTEMLGVIMEEESETAVKEPPADKSSLRGSSGTSIESDSKSAKRASKKRSSSLLDKMGSPRGSKVLQTVGGAFFELDYRKLKRALIESDDWTKMLLLQALRWRITKSTPENRDVVISSYIRHDLLGLHSDPCRPYLKNLLECYYCAPPSQFSSRLQESIARLVNSFASLTLGRDYLSVNDDLLVYILLPLFLGKHPSKTKISPVTMEHVLATLQKLSLRKKQRILMINSGLVEFMILFLSENHNKVSSYCLEYSTALLMNLCLHKETRLKCRSSAATVVKLLKDLLATKHKCALPYINGAMYSLLTDKHINKEAKNMKLGEIIQHHANKSDGEIRKQLEFIYNMHKENVDGVECVCDANAEPDEEVDLLEPELEANDPVDGVPNGEEILAKYKPTPKVKSRMSCLCRPVTPLCKTYETSGDDFQICNFETCKGICDDIPEETSATAITEGEDKQRDKQQDRSRRMQELKAMKMETQKIKKSVLDEAEKLVLDIESRAVSYLETKNNGNFLPSIRESSGSYTESDLYSCEGDARRESSLECKVKDENHVNIIVPNQITCNSECPGRSIQTETEVINQGVNIENEVKVDCSICCSHNEQEQIENKENQIKEEVNAGTILYVDKATTYNPPKIDSPHNRQTNEPTSEELETELKKAILVTKVELHPRQSPRNTNTSPVDKSMDVAEKDEYIPHCKRLGERLSAVREDDEIEDESSLKMSPKPSPPNLEQRRRNESLNDSKDASMQYEPASPKLHRRKQKKLGQAQSSSRSGRSPTSQAKKGLLPSTIRGMKATPRSHSEDEQLDTTPVEGTPPKLRAAKKDDRCDKYKCMERIYDKPRKMYHEEDPRQCMVYEFSECRRASSEDRAYSEGLKQTFCKPSSRTLFPEDRHMIKMCYKPKGYSRTDVCSSRSEVPLLDKDSSCARMAYLNSYGCCYKDETKLYPKYCCELRHTCRQKNKYACGCYDAMKSYIEESMRCVRRCYTDKRPPDPASPIITKSRGRGDFADIDFDLPQVCSIVADVVTNLPLLSPPHVPYKDVFLSRPKLPRTP